MRGYFHTDRDIDLATLAEAITRADATGASFRINVENGVLTYKVGGGSWSPPMRPTVDAYRDAPLDWEKCDRHGGIIGDDDTCPCKPLNEVEF